MVSLIQTGATQIDATTMLADLYKSNHHLYDALSYAWGSPKKARFISIGNCRLPITISLHDALLRLRDCFLERIIWVDAICINQKDTEERNNQVQRMAMIYAMANRVIVWLGEAEDNSDQALEEIHKSADGQPTKDDKEIQNAILKLLQRAWFKRIWVLQEVAAARNVLILCGPMEIDGYVFCIGINSLEITYESNPNLRNLIQSATYLIRRRVFPPTQAISKPGEFSLNIAPLGELIDMYHAREASDCRDKIYALLGMSSDNSGSGSLSPDYDIRWGTLFQQVIKRIICERVLISTWQDKEVAVIKSKGCILGQVSSVKSDATWGDRQNVTISKYVPEWNPKKAIRSRYPQDQSKDENIFWTLTLQALANSIQRGDIVCLLQGASKPTIIRPYKDCFAIIAIAVNPITDKRAEKASNSWIKVLESATDFPRNLLLVWNWTKSLSENGGDDKYLMSSQIFKDGKPTQLMEMGLVLSDLKNYGKAAEILKRAIEIYEMEFEDEYSYTIAAMTHLAAVYKALGLFGEEEKWGVMADIMSGKGTEGMVIYLISSNDVEVKKFCLNWRWDQVTITEDIIKVAAAKTLKNWHMINLLLDRRSDQITITEDIAKAIAGNGQYGEEVIKLLLNRLSDQITITENIIKAAAENMRNQWGGREMMERGDQIFITEDIVKAAAGNEWGGREVMELLLNWRRGLIIITEDIIKAAVRNKISGQAVIKLLLDRRGGQIAITENIIKVAAESNREVMELLLHRQRYQNIVTEGIVNK
ncbi:heterokaryon incompatibility domain-containing protein [Trichoderma evansii]